MQAYTVNINTVPNHFKVHVEKKRFVWGGKVIENLWFCFHFDSRKKVQSYAKKTCWTWNCRKKSDEIKFMKLEKNCFAVFQAFCFSDFKRSFLKVSQIARGNVICWYTKTGSIWSLYKSGNLKKINIFFRRVWIEPFRDLVKSLLYMRPFVALCCVFKVNTVVFNQCFLIGESRPTFVSWALTFGSKKRYMTMILTYGSPNGSRHF